MAEESTQLVNRNVPVWFQRDSWNLTLVLAEVFFSLNERNNNIYEFIFHPNCKQPNLVIECFRGQIS